ALYQRRKFVGRLNDSAFLLRIQENVLEFPSQLLGQALPKALLRGLLNRVISLFGVRAVIFHGSGKVAGEYLRRIVIKRLYADGRAVIALSEHAVPYRGKRMGQESDLQRMLGKVFGEI